MCGSLSFVRFQVIRFRNELMHSCELCVTDEWMRQYQTAVKNLVQHLSHIPEMATVGQQIEEVSMFVCVCVTAAEVHPMFGSPSCIRVVLRHTLCSCVLCSSRC